MSARQTAVLREMGLAPIWRLRRRVTDAQRCDGAQSDETSDAIVATASGVADTPAATGVDHRISPVGQTERGAVVLSPPSADIITADGGDSQQGVPTTATAVERPEVVAHPSDATGDGDTVRAERIARLDWDALETDIRACASCRLCEQRRQAVPGVGDRQADWLLVGEGPGAEEDRRGEPFVGPAGRLLDAMLAAIGLQRGADVYIANAVKCRPPLNRTPNADEIAACLPYLERQVALVRPRVLVALGKPAAQALLGTEVRINAARGKIFEHHGTPVVVTYHPAYLLRNPADKGKAWEDLCFARRIVADAAKR